MSIRTPTSEGLFQMPPDPGRRLTVDEYHQMIQTGVLTENDPVELLEGWLVHRMARNPPHDYTLDQTQEILRNHLPSWRVRVQSAITTIDSEPEPDVTVAEGPVSRYLNRHPGPPDIALLVEVAESSLAHDRNDKGRIYARAGVVIYWIINLVDRRVEVCTDPSGPTAAPAYRQRQDYGIDDFIPLVVRGQEITRIAVRDLLPA